MSAGESFSLKEIRWSKGTTKSFWLNFSEQAEALNREPNHILAYFLSELGCDGSVGPQGEMILTGNYR